MNQSVFKLGISLSVIVITTVTMASNALGDDSSFFQGDATGDGVEVYGASGSGIGMDILGLNQITANYYPVDGHIEVSSNHVGSIRILSATGALLFGNATPLASMPNGQFQDPPSATEVNWLTFNPAGLGTGNPAILDSFNLGNILPAGLTLGQALALNLRLAGAYVGAGEFDYAFPFFVPEPNSLILLSMGAVGLLRRRGRIRYLPSK